MTETKQSYGGALSKDILKNVVKFTEKDLCRSLIFNEVAGLQAATLLKRGPDTCFPLTFVEFLKTPIL